MKKELNKELYQNVAATKPVGSKKRKRGIIFNNDSDDAANAPVEGHVVNSRSSKKLQSLDHHYEIEFSQQAGENWDFVIGVDEVGRGCLAGPLVVCACHIPCNVMPTLKGINDSKLIMEPIREEIYSSLNRHSEIAYVTVHRTPDEIDRSDILACVMDAMHSAVRQLIPTLISTRLTNKKQSTNDDDASRVTTSTKADTDDAESTISEEIALSRNADSQDCSQPDLENLESPFKCLILIDGNRMPDELGRWNQQEVVQLDCHNVTVKSECIIKGDGKIFSIAAASILAKVTRDRILNRLDLDHPDYGFVDHKGYATERHKEAIHKHGALEIHRLTYRPVCEWILSGQIPWPSNREKIEIDPEVRHENKKRLRKSEQQQQKNNKAEKQSKHKRSKQSDIESWVKKTSM